MECVSRSSRKRKFLANNRNKFITKTEALSPKVFAFLRKYTITLLPCQRYTVVYFNNYDYNDYDNENLHSNKLPFFIVVSIKLLRTNQFHILGTIFCDDHNFRTKPVEFARDVSNSLKLFILAINDVGLNVVATVTPLNSFFYKTLHFLVGNPNLLQHEGPILYNIGSLKNLVHIYDPSSILDNFYKWFSSYSLKFSDNDREYDVLKEKLDAISKNFENSSPCRNDFAYIKKFRNHFGENVASYIDSAIKFGSLNDELVGTAKFVRKVSRFVIHFVNDCEDGKAFRTNDNKFSFWDSFIDFFNTLKIIDVDPKKTAVETEKSLQINCQNMVDYCETSFIDDPSQPLLNDAIGNEDFVFNDEIVDESVKELHIMHLYKGIKNMCFNLNDELKMPVDSIKCDSDDFHSDKSDINFLKNEILELKRDHYVKKNYSAEVLYTNGKYLCNYITGEKYEVNYFVLIKNFLNLQEIEDLQSCDKSKWVEWFDAQQEFLSFVKCPEALCKITKTGFFGKSIPIDDLYEIEALSSKCAENLKTSNSINCVKLNDGLLIGGSLNNAAYKADDTYICSEDNKTHFLKSDLDISQRTQLEKILENSDDKQLISMKNEEENNSFIYNKLKINKRKPKEEKKVKCESEKKMSVKQKTEEDQENLSPNIQNFDKLMKECNRFKIEDKKNTIVEQNNNIRNIEKSLDVNTIETVHIDDKDVRKIIIFKKKDAENQEQKSEPNKIKAETLLNCSTKNCISSKDLRRKITVSKESQSKKDVSKEDKQTVCKDVLKDYKKSQILSNSVTIYNSNQKSSSKEIVEEVKEKKVKKKKKKKTQFSDEDGLIDNKISRCQNEGQTKLPKGISDENYILNYAKNACVTNLKSTRYLLDGLFVKNLRNVTPGFFNSTHVFDFVDFIKEFGCRPDCYTNDTKCKPISIEESFNSLLPFVGSLLLYDSEECSKYV